MWDWVLEDLIAKRPIRWFILKARQEGVSTFWIAFFLWLTSLRANRECDYLLSHQPCANRSLPHTASVSSAAAVPCGCHPQGPAAQAYQISNPFCLRNFSSRSRNALRDMAMASVRISSFAFALATVS
jgi:hypothetical protein